MDIKEKLILVKDEQYKNFSSTLTKTKYPVLGVRIPVIKKIAKELNDSECDFSNSIYFEEIMLEGLIIGYKKDIDEVINKLKIFISKIDDWSVCDSCCANLKITNKNKEKMWNFIESYKDSEKEFEVRFMLIMMLDYYLEDDYIEEIFKIINNIKSDFYYVKMAIAWLLATSLVKCEDKTFNFLERCALDKFTFNKTISKCCESYRIRSDLKEKLKKMKR